MSGSNPAGGADYAAMTGDMFDRFPRVLRRMSPKFLWYRSRLPVRRARWDRENRALAAPYMLDTATPAPRNDRAVALGEFEARTGLGEAARAYLREVRARHGDVTAVDIAPRLAGEAMAPVDLGGPVGHVYILCQPSGYAHALGMLDGTQIEGACRTGAFVWETPHFPQLWEFSLDLVHRFWTPTRFSAASAEALDRVPVEVIPYEIPFDTSLPALPRARFGLGDGDFVGLSIMDIVSCPARKNPLGPPIAWRRAFGDDPTKPFLLKLRTNKRTRVIVREIEDLFGTDGNIRIVEEEFTRNEIYGLQRMADVFVSLHRSEGYGLNIRECLALGTPVVATDWSANTEFGPDSPLYHGVRYAMTRYSDWLNHYPGPKFDWAEADLDHAAEVLRALHAEHAVARGARAS